MKWAKDDNLEDSMTIGFGYDDPFREKSILLNNPLIISLRMINTILEPVDKKWVLYINDYARNNKLLPNIYHVITNWFKINREIYRRSILKS